MASQFSCGISKGLEERKGKVDGRTYDDGAFTPPSIPMSTDVADPVALTPNARADRDFGVELNAHLKVSLKSWFRDGIGASGRRIALETIDHSIKVTFLVRGLDGWCRDWGSVDSFVQDWIVRVVFFHRAEIVGTFEQMGALATGVFGSNRLAIDTLCRETLLIILIFSFFFSYLFIFRVERKCFVYIYIYEGKKKKMLSMMMMQTR